MIMLLCLSLSVTVSCTKKETSSQRAQGTISKEEATATVQDNAEPTKMRTVTDLFGRQVQVPEEVKTIAAIGGAARLLTYAGCADKLVGVTDMDKENIPSMPYTVVNADHFAKIGSVGKGGSKDVCYPEKLVTQSPDVIFALTDQDTVQSIQEQTGIPTIALSVDDMFDVKLYKSLMLVGDIMGTDSQCNQVVDYIKSCQKDLDARTRDIPEQNKPTVYTGAVSFRGAHGFEGTYGAYPPFDAIHAKNVVDSTGTKGALLVDREKVVVWNPDIIFLNPTNLQLVRDDYPIHRSFYDSLTAVQEDKLYAQIAYNYNWTNIELSIADAYYAGKIIYPEAFSDIDPAKKADEIFTVMLGKPIYQSLQDAGLGFGRLKIKD
jgi:iron complex transport system substrate-binding protein